ncbi:MAG: polyisoprenoid-binding protein YceI [Flammeovirgaceae bacterium]|jgi:polyisoprenoid-binding protein YceI
MKKLNIFFAFFLAISLVACGGKEKAGDDTEVADTTKKEVASVDGTYKLAGDSQLMWEGKKVAYGHTGTMKISEGQFTIADGAISEGNFTIDMTSLECTDIVDDAEKKAKLEGHLKTADFFNTEEFSKAMFTVTGSEKLEGNADATHKIMGDLTLKGVTKPIEFMANVGGMEGGISIASSFDVDRTEFGVEFNSPKFSAFENLAADKIINDNMGIKFDLKAMK